MEKQLRDIIGMELKYAEAMAGYLGMTLRVIKKDGKSLLVTQEDIKNRINVGILNNRIQEIISVE